jgi:hypothetical protein
MAALFRSADGVDQVRIPAFAAESLVTALVAGVALSGCGAHTSTTSSSSPSSSSKARPPADYNALLIRASDITQPADFFTNAPATGFNADAPTLNPNGKPGVAGVFKSQDNSRQITDTVLVLGDALAAKSALDNAVPGIGNLLAFPAPQPFPVGANGTMYSGLSRDQTKTVTVVMFTQGKAFATLEFDGAPNDPVDTNFLDDVSQKQDAAIKAGLPS